MGKIQMMFRKTACFIGLFMIAVPFTGYAAPSEIFYENASSTPLFSLISNAKISIDIEIYEIEDTRIHAAILRAMNRGVKVRVVQESEAYGSNCSIFEKAEASDSTECKSQKKFVQNVKSKGGTYVPFPYQQLCADADFRCLEHGKMILVDGKKVMLSTGNFNPTSLCDPKGVSGKKDSSTGSLSVCNRDYSVVSTDPKVVATLSEVFESDLRGKAYDLQKILARDEAEKVTVSPHSLSPIVRFIRSAKTSVQVQNQYLKDAEMNAEIIAAAKRGVKVSIMVTSACAFGKPDPVKDAGAIGTWKENFKAFDAAGVKSRIFTRQILIGGLNGYLHAKAIVVDGKRAWVGSVNGSTQALTKNREFGIFFEDAEQVTTLAKQLATDFKHPMSESWRESLRCKKDF